MPPFACGPRKSSRCCATPWPEAGTASASGWSPGSRSTTPPHGAATSSCSSRASRSPPCSSRRPPPKATRAGARSWSTTPVDVAALGLTPVGELPLVTLAYMLAQKLHACTDHSVPERENDRARDLIDILLVHRLLADDELPDVRR